jgi:hypothetical protein
LSPAPGAQIVQNDPSTGCTAHPTRGYGFQIAFDWTEVPGASQYRVYAKSNTAAIALVDVIVPISQYTFVDCNAFAAAGNGWSWQVYAFSNGVWGPPSPPRPFEFLPCRLESGAACE